MRRFENAKINVSKGWIRVGLRVDTLDILKTLNSECLDLVSRGI